DSSVALTTFADADHAGCQDTRRSTSGSVQFLRERLISWSSKRQKSAAISSMEAEYIALSGCYSNPLLILKASIPPKRKVDLTTGINFLGTMATTIKQQVAMNEALIPSTQREMLHICLRIHGQSFDELPFKEEILDFIRFFGHSATIRTLTDININKLYQPWRSFAGLYHKRNIDYAFLIWEDFVYQVEHKNHKKSNEMYYPRFTKVIIHHFMSKDPSIPRRNKINWHYVRDDSIFSTIKVVSRHQNTQQYSAMLPIELTNDEIGNTKAYKKYYAFATEEAAPKPKASARRKRSGSDTSITPLIATTTPKTTVAVVRTEAQQLKIVLRRSRQQTCISQPGGLGIDEGTSSKPGVPDVPTDESEEELSWNSSDDEGSEDKGDGEEDQGLNVNKEEHVEEEEEDELFRDVNINQGRGLQATLEVDDTHVTLTPINCDGQQESSSVSSQFVTSMLNPTSDVGMESIFVIASSSMAPLHTSTPIMTPSTIATITTISQAPIPPMPIPSEVLQNLPTFDSVFRFDERLKSLEANFSEYRQTNPFAEAVSNIPGIVHQYMNQQMNETVRVAVQIQTDRLRDSYQRENDEFLRTINENMKRIIKEQVKAEVLTRSSHSSRTSYAVVADLSKMELKKILIEKMEGNKSIQRSDEQRNLYKALVDAYEADKIILDSYGETVILKRRHDDDDKDKEPSAGSDRGSKRRREGKEPESASAPLKTTTRSAGRSTTWSKPRQASTSEFAFAEEPVLTTSYIEEPSHPVFETELEYHLEEVYKATTDQLDWVNPEGQQYPHNLLQPLPLIPDNRGRREPIDYDKHALWGVSHWGRKRQQFYGFAINRESALDVYSKRRIIAVTNLKIMEWHSYKHLDWISKRLNLTKPDTYRSDLKRKEAYTAYSNPRGFIYQNKDKKNRLIRIDELHKFSDGTLNDVRTALNYRLKGIRMQYLPQTIWRKGDKDRAVAMIQSIDKMLKTRRIMRSLEKFVGGRLYEGDFWMLQRTI
nr:putative mitochondrial protein [Tanacetum cinerariifolium]